MQGETVSGASQRTGGLHPAREREGMPKKNAFYAQSGGVTAVINATASGVIETARKHKKEIGKIYAGRNGIIGALTEDLIDTNKESAKAIAGLRYTPAGAFGSCRYKLKGLEENKVEYERLIEVFKAHNIGYSFTTAAVIPRTQPTRCHNWGKSWDIPLPASAFPRLWIMTFL
jgi:6-phosphofructokinase